MKFGFDQVVLMRHGQLGLGRLAISLAESGDVLAVAGLGQHLSIHIGHLTLNK